ncbi:deoxyribodipyrimidine photo-lyase [Rhizobium rosettiformans]|uniref:Deoxyribodipyrimidine photolyase n=2 Tax=Rhizobium rosettiformans TaxID=1368430 RepID=A0A4V4HQX1_9HYPH|nr:FAD-binding domain-containing protein [Rhizobium rosettiformans]MBB5276675.1 deoxyribodipyrimidine photo-lyase [Rhizobium rosettiformans]THV35476.1 deoxyribodipyrimidine photolyase [Rhizobium rosettiformans W3]
MADTAIALTRDAALRRLDDFLPDAAGAYARLRNKENGPGRHVHVSRLSAALRRRLVSEEEVVRAVVARHGLSKAEKFVSEVFWRTYWKGWLEQRPSIWDGYVMAVERTAFQLEASAQLRQRYTAAMEARTGIDCFDAWALELTQTGYLHNWARMQFASIWIFTLGLPWELGAAFMFDQLIDADPASNTLSWRWVAGLHTVGKAYLADAERIQAMTEGRFAPRDLARTARIPADSLVVPQPAAVRQAHQADPSAATLLLLTVEDLSVEQLAPMRSLPVQALAVLEGRNAWDQTALSDGLARAAQVWPEAALVGNVSPADIAETANAHGCSQIATAFLPVGPVAASIAPQRAAFAEQGLRFAELLRDWDRRSWPHCRRGFFALKEKIPALVQEMVTP